MSSANTEAFFKLVKAGLWEKEARLSQFGVVNYVEITSLAEEQSVIGLVASGLEHVTDVRPPREDVLQFVGQTLQLEQQNLAMNSFIGNLIEKLRHQGIYAILVKGQGIAKCYEKPLWRACGDVDLFLSDDNYEKAKTYLSALASSVEGEYVREKHLGMTIDEWVVELHGRLYSGLSSKVERELDKVYEDTFYGGAVRSWDNNGVQVFLLKVENDVFYVFTHILQHFFKEGLGLRQVCDWCRLLWTYRDSLDYALLELRVRRAGLMTLWRAFGAFAVEYLGMPIEAMPFYSSEEKWKREAEKICAYILEVGNMGHNRDKRYMKYPYLVRKCFSASRRIGDLINHARIFPLDSVRFSFAIMKNGLKSAIKGEG
jgi:hypothetical protein